MQSREDDAKKVALDMLVKFQAVYFESMREVIYSLHKEKLAKKNNTGDAAAKVGKDGAAKVRRLRNQQQELKSSAERPAGAHPKFSAKVVCSQSVDIPSGTYIAYVIFTRMGDERSLVYRRFKEFRELSQFIEKKKKALKLPPRVGTKIESRNLKSEMIVTRSQLLGEYLKTINESADVQDIKEVQKWLGIGGSSDQIMVETFKKTLFRLKSCYGIWKKLIYHHNVDAIFKLVCEKVRADVYPELDNPGGATQRELTKLKESFQTVSEDLEAMVNKSAAAVSEQISHVKHQTQNLLASPSDYEGVVAQEMSSRKNALQLLIEIFKSAWPKMLTDLTTLTSALDAPLLLVLQKLTHFQILAGEVQQPVNFDAKMREILERNSPAKIDEFHSTFARLKTSVKSHLTIQLSFALPPIVEQLDAKIHTDKFDILQHVTLLPDIIGAVLDLADPANLFIVFSQVLDCKYALLQEHPVNIKKIEEILDSFEAKTADRIWLSEWKLESDGYYNFYELWDIVGNAGPYADAYKNFFLKLVKIDGRALTKFSYKFGDNISAAIKKEVRDWKDTIDECVLAAYESAKKSAVKQISVLAREFVVNVILAGITPQMRKVVLGPLVNLYNPMQGQTPVDNLDVVLGQERIYEAVADDVLRGHVEVYVSSLAEKYKQQLSV